MTTRLGVKGLSTLLKLPSYITFNLEVLRANTITLRNLDIEIHLLHVACERTVLCPVVDFSFLNYLTNFQLRNSLYYYLISKWFLPFRFSFLILFKPTLVYEMAGRFLVLHSLLVPNTWHIIECQKMDKLTVLRNTTSFNLVDMNLSNYTMSYFRRLESEYTHTLLENIPSATEEGLQKKKIRLPSSTLMLILWKANYWTFQTEKLQLHLTMTESSSFFCKFTSYV